MPEISWIKLSLGIFEDEKIKLLGKLPEGSAIINLWLRLLCLAGKCNDGGMIYLSQNIPYTDEMLSALSDIPLNTVRMAMETFTGWGMIELLGNGNILLANWEKYQNVESLERIREQTRARVAAHRERRRIDAPCNVTETLRNATDIDIDKEEDKEKSIMSGKPDATPPKTVKVAEEAAKVLEIMTYLNERAGTHYPLDPVTPSHASHIKARLREKFAVDDFKRAIVWCVSEWKDDVKMGNYIRPDTIFNTKMPGYVENYYRKKRNLTEEDE